MRKDFGKRPLIYPQPVLIVGTYNDDGSPDVMTAAWGGVGDDHQVFLCLSPEHMTVKNILKRRAFTVSFATEDTVVPADYVGIVSGNDVPDKFERSGLHAERSAFVDAPVITDFPVCMECELESYEDVHCHCFGNIVNTSVDESVLTDGKIDLAKLRAIAFDIAGGSYLKLGELCAKAFSAGKTLK
jgi:flavin reductase (DIM6/NTAB) family NADH-FMN oxidoreductase RutF